jgi:signal transduction histidine kinase
MSEYDVVDLMRREAELRARIPFLSRKRPLLPVPEVTLLLDAQGRIVRHSGKYAGELLNTLTFKQGRGAHEVFHPDCKDDACEFLKQWQSAWDSHGSGLPVEWLFLSEVSQAVVKLRLQPVSYACQVLFEGNVDEFSSHSVLFIQDISRVGENEDVSARDVHVKNAFLYERRRAGDTDPDLIASLDERLRQQTRKLLNADSSIRRQLAQELHDSLGQTLSLVRLEVESVAASQQDGACQGQLTRAIAQIRQAQEELRTISDDLHAEEGQQTALVDLLKGLVTDFNNAKTDIDLVAEFDIESADLPGELAITAYRIAQEALHNVARHSKATCALISITQDAEGVSFLVSDNGCGLPENSTHRRGLGLITMRERAERLGAKFETDCPVGEGCTIRIRWPAAVVSALR